MSDDVQQRAAFIVIVDHSEGHEPVIGDVLWALLDSRAFDRESNPDWKIHVTDLTPEMLAHHRLLADPDTARPNVDDLVLAFYDGVPWEELTIEQQERFQRYQAQRDQAIADPDTARLRRLGEAVEDFNRTKQVRKDLVPYRDAWDQCLDAIYREAGVEQ